MADLGNGSMRREMLPSERELALGFAPSVEDSAGRSVTEDVPPARPRVRSQFRQYLREADPRRIEGPRLPLYVLGISGFLGAWSEHIIGLFFPEMRAEFGLNLQFLFVMTAVMAVAFSLVQPAIGFLADRVKRVWMMRVGQIIEQAGLLAVSFSPALPQVVGGFAISGVGKNLSEPAARPLMADYYPFKSRARVLAFGGAIGTLGTLTGLMVAGTIAQAIGWRGAVKILALMGIALSLLTFLLREPIRGYFDRLEMGASEATAVREQAPVTWAEGWRAVGAIKSVRRLWYATPFMHIGFVTVFTALNLYYAEEFGLGPQARASISVAGTAAGFVGLLLGGPLAARFLAYKPGRVPQALSVLVALNAVNVVILCVSNNLWLSIALTLPIQFGNSLFGPAMVTLFTYVIPARIRGLGLSSFSTWTLLALLLQIPVGGWLDSHPLRQGMLIFSPVLIIAAIITWTVGYGVEHDIRNALAASMADEDAARAREEGHGKIVVARDVDVHYDGVQILFNVDLDVYEGEIVALLGTNGAGKSTLLRALSGLTEPSAGAIFVDGRDTTHLPPHQLATLGIAQMPGGRSVFPGLTVAENLTAAAWLAEREDHDGLEAEKKRLITEMFPTLGERLHQAAGTLSGGEQQMVGIAQAFLMKPRLLMIDELSLGLAPSIVRHLMEALRQMRERGTTIIFVEQSVNMALTIADRAVFMEKGEVRFTGATEELLQRRDLVRSVLLRGPDAGTGMHRAVAKQADGASSTVIAARDLTVSFGGVAALRDASIDVTSGEIVGIIGPNGAGKTTLFDVLTGFVRPDQGRVLIGREDVTVLSPDQRAHRGLGRSFQDSRLFPAMTVRENIMVGLERHLDSKTAVLSALWTPKARRANLRAARRAETLIEMLGLGDYRDKLVADLSTGVRRLTDLAVQLAADPDVLLLDEPSSGIAQAETVELGVLLRRVRREANCALVVIEHDMDLIAGISDRLIAMDLGRVVMEGPPPAVLADERVIAAYLGGADPEAAARMV